MRMMVTILLEKNTLPRDYRPWISRLFHISLYKQGGEQLVQQHFGGVPGKLFSFSVYLPKSHFGQEIVLESSYIKVIFSAFDENVFDDFFLAMMGMQGQKADMEGNLFQVSSVVRIIEKTVQEPAISIHMLSPLVVRPSTAAKQESRGCLGIRDPEFEVHLRSTVAGMLSAANLEADMLESLHIAAGGDPGCKEAHVLHKGRFYRSTLGNLQLCGEPALLNLLYHGGMGEMREEGFGLFELNA